MMRSTSKARTETEKRWLRVLSTLNEFQARLFVADKALDLGRGGIRWLSQLTGMSRTTITKAVQELHREKKLRVPPEGGARRPGGGGKKLEQTDPRLQQDLRRIVEESTAGDPMSLLLDAEVHPHHGPRVETLGALPSSRHGGAPAGGYGLLVAGQPQGQGRAAASRDGQFRYIHRQVNAFRRRGDPVISVDAKKHETHRTL